MASSTAPTANKLRGIIDEYQPGKNGRYPDEVIFPENLYIGLFGKTGCGKSSLINSLRFAMSGVLIEGRMVSVACQDMAGGHTMTRMLYNLARHIYVIDNRGFAALDNGTYAELRSQLYGEVGLSREVEWKESKEDKLPVDLKKGYAIGCAIVVFSAIHTINSENEDINIITDFLKFLHKHQGCYPMAIITHVDVAEKNEIETIRTLLRDGGVEDICEVANITKEKQQLEDKYQLRLLKFLDRCLFLGDQTCVFRSYKISEEEKKQKEKVRREKKEQEKKEKEAEEKRKQEEHDMKMKKLEQDMKNANIAKLIGMGIGAAATAAGFLFAKRK